LIILTLLYVNQAALDFGYHNYTQMVAILQNFASQYPQQASLVDIGQTEGGTLI
jgi:hypothetical protein